MVHERKWTGELRAFLQSVCEFRFVAITSFVESKTQKKNSIYVKQITVYIAKVTGISCAARVPSHVINNFERNTCNT